jgi:hypothetical protein
MTQLELQQRGLLDLIKSRGAPPADPYLAKVAHSPGLTMVREIALWWRAMQLEVQCRFTSRLLKRINRFEATVAQYFDTNPTSSFVEELSRDFLRSLQADADSLVAAVSQFEYALLEARRGSTESFAIRWDRNPDGVFLALEKRLEIPPPDSEWTYETLVCGVLPNWVTCSRERVPDTTQLTAQSIAMRTP